LTLTSAHCCRLLELCRQEYWQHEYRSLEAELREGQIRTPTATTVEADMNLVKVEHLFPSPVFKFKLPPEVNKRLEPWVRALEMRQTNLRQTSGDLHKREDFAWFNQYLLDGAKATLDAWGAQYEDVQITNCWANIYSQSESIHAHSHPNCFLSSVYYVRVPQGKGKIMFFDPRVMFTNTIVPMVHRPTIYNASSINLPMEEGVLLFWPFWLQHANTPNETGEERISIAANIMFKGLLGSYAALNALEL
jgi:uncharacterized protein (TIGR02466 family)